MRKSEVEAWVLDVIARVKAGQPNEDARIELKREWPEPKKAARRIAGHANAAGGDLVLWIIGVDQAVGVVGVNDLDFAKWFPQVLAEFNELAPTLVMDLNVPVSGKTVVALLFETDRAPFVVKNSAHGATGAGPVELEVPWREGTRVRTANRSELLRILSPLQRLPSFEVLDGEIELTTLNIQAGLRSEWELSLKIYVIPKATPVVLPFHKCKGSFKIEGADNIPPLHNLQIFPHADRVGIGVRKQDHRVGSIQGSASEVIIEGPGMITFVAESSFVDPVNPVPQTNAHAVVELVPADAGRACIVTAEFRYSRQEEFKHIWSLIRARA